LGLERMLFSIRFNAKVVHNQREYDGACGVFPQAKGIETLEISVWEKGLL
jgi:hypothetical protein